MEKIPSSLLISPDHLSHLNESECIQLQKQLCSYIQLHNTFPAPFSEPYPVKDSTDIHTIAGVDLAYWKEDIEKAVCCIVVLDLYTGEILEKTWAFGEILFPYVPGCLAFRELPLVIRAAQQLSAPPDLYMFDGNGILHPRRMGLATHASFYLNRPTLGVAKNYYKIEETDFTPPEGEAGSYCDIVINGDVLGRTLRTHTGVRPVFVSPGNYMDMNTAMNLCLHLVAKESHIPIPTRYADLETHTMRAQLQTAHSSRH